MEEWDCLLYRCVALNKTCPGMDFILRTCRKLAYESDYKATSLTCSYSVSTLLQMSVNLTVISGSLTSSGALAEAPPFDPPPAFFFAPWREIKNTISPNGCRLQQLWIYLLAIMYVQLFQKKKKTNKRRKRMERRRTK